MSALTRFFDLCVRRGIRKVQPSLDLREVHGNGPSEKTLLAAAFFASRAAPLGLTCTPFLIPPRLIEQTNSLQDRHFPVRKQKNRAA